MENSKIETQLHDLSMLIRTHMGIGGKSLSRQLRRASRYFPRHLRRDLEPFAQADSFQGHPRLLLTVNHAAIDSGYARLQAYLKSIDPTDRRKGRVLGVLGALSMNLLIVMTLLLILLRWRGFI